MKRPEGVISEFAKSLEPVGRILEQEGYAVWGCSPIYGKDGKVHVFYSRWKRKYPLHGWVGACEVGHAIADTPEGPYTHVDVALKGEGGDAWDGWSIHNPSIYEVDGKYIILYMGSTGKDLGLTIDEMAALPEEEGRAYYRQLVGNKRVGMAISDSLDGPFTRVSLDAPIVDVGVDGTWDNYCTSNPAFVVTPEGKYRLYYKAWNKQTATKFNGNRMYGYAEADCLTGPYTKFEANPVIDYSCYDERIQTEDGYIWYEGDKYHMVLRDMGVFNHQYGLYTESIDGITWDEPQIAYMDATYYFGETEGIPESENRFERAQMLMKYGKPEYMFCGFRGGKFGGSSGVVFKIKK